VESNLGSEYLTKHQPRKTMLNINEEDLKNAIVEKAAETILNDSCELSELIAKEVKSRVDAIFKDRADAQLNAAVDAAIVNGFDLEYQRINNWGQPEGPKTTIRKQLDKIVSSYWSERVEPRTGKPTDSSYTFTTRAEYLMTQICAKDFSENLKDAALSVTGGLKDGLRIQLAKQMDSMLDGLFHVKSLQDQGKVQKPY